MDKIDTARVLVVDDDPAILLFVSANLSVRGFEVMTAESGEEALGIMEETIPDLVILDIMMPRMSGTEVCRQIRDQYGVPVIMLTALAEIKTKAELLDLGADDYITKPFGVKELMARVRAVLRRKFRA